MDAYEPVFPRDNQLGPGLEEERLEDEHGEGRDQQGGLHGAGQAQPGHGHQVGESTAHRRI